MVGRDTYLNDSVIHMCIRFVCDLHRGAMLFTSYNRILGWPTTLKVQGHKTPDGDDVVLDLSTMKYLVFPFNDAMHWSLIIVEVDYNNGFKLSLYDPLSRSNSELEVEWEDAMLPFLIKWNADCTAQRKKWNETHAEPQLPYLILPEITKIWLADPRQPDRACCGVMIIAQTYAIMNGMNGFNSLKSLTVDYVRTMRQRVLWICVCYFTMLDISPERREGLKDVHDKLVKHLGKMKSLV